MHTQSLALLQDCHTALHMNLTKIATLAKPTLSNAMQYTHTHSLTLMITILTHAHSHSRLPCTLTISHCCRIATLAKLTLRIEMHILHAHSHSQTHIPTHTLCELHS